MFQADGTVDHVPNASEYNHVEIEYLSPIMDAASNNKFEISHPEAVAYIDTSISTSLTASQEEKLENNHTNQYTIKLSNETGGYRCSLYYDTLYDKAYLVKDGGTYETETDFARKMPKRQGTVSQSKRFWVILQQICRMTIYTLSKSAFL
jgi:hypothetical protein